MLDGIPLFDTLSDRERSTVAMFTQERHLAPGESLFSEGEDAIALYVVKAGSLKAFRDRSSGEQVLGYIGVGGIVGEMALFDADAPKKRTASVRAVEESLLLVVMDYAILELSKQAPEVYGKIERTIRERRAENDWR